MQWGEVRQLRPPKKLVREKLITDVDENIYTDAEAFRPERWFAGSDLVKEPSAFSPFSKGKLAVVELSSSQLLQP